jgi:hypothetical protein
VPKVVLLTLQMVFQRPVDHEAEVIAQVPLLVRSHQLRVCVCRNLSSPLGVEVWENILGARVGGIAAKRGNGGGAVGFCCGFEADAVDAEYFTEL